MNVINMYSVFGAVMHTVICFIIFLSVSKIINVCIVLFADGRKEARVVSETIVSTSAKGKLYLVVIILSIGINSYLQQ